jgi:hypothetical protein
MLYYKKTDNNLKKNTKSHKRSKRRNNNINDLMIMGYDDIYNNDYDDDNDDNDDENIITKQPTNISLQDFIKDTELNSYDDDELECICYFCTNRIDFYNFNYYNMQDIIYHDYDYYYDDHDDDYDNYYDYDYHDLPELESISDYNSECSTYEGDSNVSDSDIENI